MIYLEAAWKADPISCVVAALALGVIMIAGLFSPRGFAEATIIKYTSTFATIGSMLKLGTWVAESAIGNEAPLPSGTDFVLMAGGGLAFIVVITRDTFQGDEDDGRSWATRALFVVPERHRAWIFGWFPSLHPPTRRPVSKRPEVVQDDQPRPSE